MVESSGSGCCPGGQAIQSRKKRGIIGCKRAAKLSPKVVGGCVGGWGIRTQKGKGKQKIKSNVDNGVAGFSLGVTLVTDPKFGAFPDLGRNTTIL